jgi:hypothetical protein
VHVGTFVCYFYFLEALNCETSSILYPLFRTSYRKTFSKTDVLSLVLKVLNFTDEISIKRGECNTPIKTNLLIKRNLFHKSNQQRSSIMVFNETQNH